MPRYFTLESARRILPEVRRLMAAAMQARAEMAEIRRDVEAFRERAQDVKRAFAPSIWDRLGL